MIISEAISDLTLPWSQADEEILNNFLQSDTGKRFLPKLLEQSVPPLLEKGHVNAILIRSGEVRGVQSVVQGIIALSHSTPLLKTTATEYPAPENDAAWNDGQRLEVPTTPKE